MLIVRGQPALREDAQPAGESTMAPPPVRGSTRPAWFAVAFAALVCAAWPAVEAAIQRADAPAIDIAVPAIPGWTVDADAKEWSPPYRNASATRQLVFRRGDDAVGVFVASTP